VRHCSHEMSEVRGQSWLFGGGRARRGCSIFVKVSMKGSITASRRSAVGSTRDDSMERSNYSLY
jgi:hypothetical protein